MFPAVESVYQSTHGGNWYNGTLGRDIIPRGGHPAILRVLSVHRQ